MTKKKKKKINRVFLFQKDNQIEKKIHLKKTLFILLKY